MSSFKDAFIEKYNLPKEESGNYVSYREDDEYFYVDIGRNPEIEAIWSESQARIKALEEKYHQKLLDILTDLQEEVKKSSEEKNLSLMPAIAVTPSKGSSTKKAGRNKRPAPPSSSINKLILRRSKRGSGHLQQNVVANSASKLEVKQKMVVEGGNITPAKLTSISTAAFGASTRLQLTPLPATIRRQNIEREKEDKLIASEEKRKKADEKKQDQLKARTQALKEERDARMEKIARNKAALEKKAMEAAAAKGLLPSVSAESQQAAADNGSGAGAGPKRYKLRRQVLATVTSHKPTATAEKPTGPLTRAAKAKAAAEASSSTQPTNNAGDGSSNNSSTAATRPNKSAGKKGGSAKRGSKKLPVSSKKTAATRKAANTTTKKGAATKKATPIEQQQQQQPTQPNSNNTPMVFSPIVCENTQRKGVNRRLSETFTSEAANTSGRNSTFAVPQPPSKVPKVVNTTANTTATIAAGSGPHCSTFQAGNSLLLMTPSAAAVTGKGSVVAASASQYEMTPPPKTPSYLTDNYDISKYIDSDDEEAQEAAEKAAEKKPIPQWALGKPFLKQLMRQFGRQSPEEMTAQAERLFIKPRIPVPLEEMGLPVREKYVARSSSVNWKTIAEIECQLKKK